MAGALGTAYAPAQPAAAAGARSRRTVWALALVVGTLGGIYGIGGGSLLAPVLLAMGFSVYEVAPATFTANFLTSLAGTATYQVRQLTHGGAIAPDWALAAWLGAGGFAGAYLGARWQRHVLELALRRLLGALACAVAARYVAAVVQPSAPSARHSHVR